MVELLMSPLSKISGSLQSLENDRGRLCLLRGKPQKQASSSQCADDDKKESTLAAQEVGPAANTENAVAIAEWEVGPTGDNKGIGSSAREVGPAANAGETVGSAKQISGPIASPGDALSRERWCYSAWLSAENQTRQIWNYLLI